MPDPDRMPDGNLRTDKKQPPQNINVYGQVTLHDPQGRQIAPPVALNTEVGAPRPHGM